MEKTEKTFDDLLRPELNRRVKGIRKALNLKQVEIADLLEIDQSVYSRMENGFINLSYGVVLQLVYKIQVNPSFLFFGEGEMIRKEGVALQKFANVKMEDSGNFVIVTVKVPKGGLNGN